MKLSKVAVLFLSVGLGACATGPRYGGAVSYGDAKGVEQVTNEFGSTDLQMIAESLSRQMLQSPIIANSQGMVRLRLADVKNKTTEYIDTRVITEKIRRQLLATGRVEFAVGNAEMQNQVDSLRRQNQTGMYDSKTTAKMGKMQAEKYLIQGSISSIVKRGNVKDVWYNFELSLTDVERGVIVWAGEKEIRKTSGR